MFIIHFICLVLLFSIGCSQDKLPENVEIINGIKHIHNTLPEYIENTPVEFKLIGKIGDLETTDENFQLFDPYDVARDNEDNIYIVEIGNQCIKKFNPEHKFLMKFGREGEGPGEFNVPTSINLDESGNIYITDGPENRVQVLDPNGKYLRQFVFSGYRSFLHVIKSGKYVISRKKRLNLPFDPEESAVRMVDEKGNLIAGLGKLRIFDDERISKAANSLYIAKDSENNIYLSFRNQNRIEKYSPAGKLLYVMDRQLNFEPFFKVEIRETVFRGQVIDRSPAVFMANVTDRIFTDNKDRLWICAFTKQEEEGDKKTDYLQFQVFSSEGEYLFNVPYPSEPHNFFKILGNRLFLIDTYTEMCVYKFEITEK
ncbi:NHL repeat-containing protein [candidate division KSB1 bacterium]